MEAENAEALAPLEPPIEPPWSWNTKFSRTNVSTVEGLGFTQRSEASSVDSLDSILRYLRVINVELCRYDEIEDAKPVGQGETFYVERCQYHKRTVAVKHIRLDLRGPESNRQSIRRRLRSVLGEIMIMHHPPLAHHPNILDLIGYGWHIRLGSPLPYVIVEYGSGGSLRRYLQAQRVPLQSKMMLGGDVAAGLIALHQCGIVHGDLKLDNVIVLDSWERPSQSIAKISDFGHSSFPRENENEKRRYYGTVLYNAPEVASQAVSPIKDEDLHRCDVWAYGLLVWEVILDGSTYFQESWCNDPAYAISTISTESDVAEGTADAAVRLPQDSEGDIWGNFDRACLRDLAKQCVFHLPSSSQFEKSYLKPLFERTLQIDPQKRITDLTRLPIFGIWNSVGYAPLQSKLSLHAGTGDLTFDLFRPDTGRDILWEHQKEILQDLENLTNRDDVFGNQSDPEFQTAVCYTLGFGCTPEYTKATQYFLRAKEHGHPILRHFGESILSVVGGYSTDTSIPYTRTIARIFQEQQKLNTESILITGGEGPDSSFSCSSVAFGEWVQTITSYSDYYAELNGCDQKLTLLELAIAYDGDELVSLLAKHSPLNNFGAWGETPLIQACRRGNSKIAKILLEAGAETDLVTQDKLTVYHWLFMLDTSDDKLMDMFFDKTHIQKDVLNILCNKTYTLHPQWPLRLTGTPLAFAVQTGCTTIVKRLLQYGVNPLHIAMLDEGRIPRWTAAHLAARYHYPEILKLLLDSEPNFSNQSLEYQSLDWPIACSMSTITAVERYAIHGTHFQANMASCLKVLGEELNSVSKLGQTPLMEAIDCNDKELVVQLLRNNHDLASMRLTDPTDSTKFNYPIHFAAQIGSNRDASDSICIVEAIFESDPSSLQALDCNRRTALHLAAAGTSSVVTSWILRHGAEVEAIDDAGRSAVHYARFTPNIRALSAYGIYMDRIDHLGYSSVHLATATAREDCLAELVRGGARLDIVAPILGAPLHVAVSKGFRNTVLKLLKYPTPIDQRDLEGCTSLLRAVKSKQRDLVELLISHGASSDTSDDDGNTPLGTAVKLQMPRIVELLLPQENIASGQQELVELLHESARLGDEDSFKLLLGRCLLHGMTISARNPTDNRTILQTAILAKRLGMVLIILKHNPEVNVTDNDGTTPLLATFGLSITPVHRSNFIQVLLKHGADVLVEDSNGRNAWDHAYESRDFASMTVLISAVVRLQSIESFIRQKSLPPDLILEAIRALKWDFMTASIGFGLLSEDDLTNLFGKDAAMMIAYAQLGDKAMIEYRIRFFRTDDIENSFLGLSHHSVIQGIRNFYKELHDSRASASPPPRPRFTPLQLTYDSS